MHVFIYVCMKIDLNDIFTPDMERLLDALTDKSAEELASNATELYGRYEDMSLLDFLDCIEGDYSCIGVDAKKDKSISIGKAVWLKGFAAFCEDFGKICNRLVVPESADSKQAHKGEVKMTMREGMLVFTRSYFGFHSFEEAAKVITVGEYIVARKDTYNSGIYQRNRAEIDKQKVQQQQARKR